MKYILNAIILSLIFISCKTNTSTSLNLPEVETFDAITYMTKMTFFGEVFSRGDGEIIDRGFCVSINEQNLRENCFSEGGNQLGEFEFVLRQLQPNTNYFYQAFAENSEGRGFGQILTNRTSSQENWSYNYEYDDGFPNGELRSVMFLNESLGWVVGNRGIILKTVNGGETWESTLMDQINTREDLISVYFSNINIGWVLSSEGMLYETSNGGNTWVSSKIDSDINLIGTRDVNISRNDKSLIVINLRNSKILISENGGVDWELRSLPFNFSPSYVSIYNESNLYLSTSSKLYFSSNLGTSLEELTPTLPESNNTTCGMFFQITINNLFCVGTSGPIYESKDKGESWTQSQRGAIYPSNPEQPYFINDELGWFIKASNDGFPYRTEDSGNSWNRETLSESVSLEIIFYINNENIWGLGGKYIFKYN